MLELRRGVPAGGTPGLQATWDSASFCLCVCFHNVRLSKKLQSSLSSERIISQCRENCHRPKVCSGLDIRLLKQLSVLFSEIYSMFSETLFILNTDLSFSLSLSLSLSHTHTHIHTNTDFAGTVTTEYLPHFNELAY